MRWKDHAGRRLKLRDLHILTAVVQSGSMAKAARDLAISQPVISKTIMDLERAVGVTLLDRARSGVEPTLYGRALLKHSVVIFDELRQSISEIEFLANPTVGRLSIGCSESISSAMLPPVVCRFARQYPGVVLDVGSGDTTALLRKLRGRELDLIFVRISGDFWAHHHGDDLNVEILFNDELVIVVGDKNRWARRRKIDLAELSDERWILAESDTWSHKLVAEAFRKRGLGLPRISIRSLSVNLRNYLLSEGPFITALPRSILSLHAERFSLKALPIELQPRPWPAAILTLKHRTISPVAERFIECAREVAKPMAACSNPTRS